MAEMEMSSVVSSKPQSTIIYTEAKLSEESVYVETRYGKVLVTIQGNQDNTPFVTYHDIGLNSQIQYHGFFNFADNEPVMQSFCAYHINAIGQEEGAETLPTNYPYPTCDQLAETVLDVAEHFKLKTMICFGVGMGANVLARFALRHPTLVAGIIFINLVSTKCGWIEWGYQKWNRWYLSSGQYTEFTNNYLIWHHFGYNAAENHHDLIQTYSDVFSKLNPVNLSHLINSYISRTDLGIERDAFQLPTGSTPTTKKFNFKCPVLNIMGDMSPHDDDVVDTNARLDPRNSSFVKFSDCAGMVLEEQPAKLAEAIRHFLQGLGFVPFLSITRHSLANRFSDLAIQQKQFLAQVSLSDSEAFGLSSLDMETDSLKPVHTSNVNV